jgi:pimeloyl-ACP methyl ester carboxylesterase
MYTFETLPLCDHCDEPIPHRFLRRQAPSAHAALLLPDADVAFLHPALYVGVLACMRCEADILWVGYGARPRFRSRSLAEQAHQANQANQAKQDTVAAYRALLERRPYQRLTLIGKSLGTLAMGELLTTARLEMPAQAIWLPPLWRDQELREQLRQVRAPSLFVIGTRDAQ